MLNDIQYLFELALLSSQGDFGKGFVESTSYPLVVLDTKGEDFIEKGDATLLCTNMFEEYEKDGLPSEEEVNAIQQKLGIAKMGLEDTVIETQTLKSLGPCLARPGGPF